MKLQDEPRSPCGHSWRRLWPVLTPRAIFFVAEGHNRRWEFQRSSLTVDTLKRFYSTITVSPESTSRSWPYHVRAKRTPTGLLLSLPALSEQPANPRGTITVFQQASLHDRSLASSQVRGQAWQARVSWQRPSRKTDFSTEAG